MSAFANYPSLKDQNIYITGGASGIGREMVEAFVAQGARVGVFDFDQTKGQALAASHDDIHFEFVDLRDIHAMKTTFSHMRDKIGGANVLVNNAARDDRHDWRETTPEYWDERMETNLRHMFFAIQAVAPDMIESGKGSIINMGSNSWWEKGTNFPAYATAKSAVHGLTRTMAKELGPHRIRVNAVVPGWIMTERQKDLWATPESLETHRQNQCLPDLIDPIYVARMVLFLASDDSAMCTASDFRVEAGSI